MPAEIAKPYTVKGLPQSQLDRLLSIAGEEGIPRTKVAATRWAIAQVLRHRSIEHCGDNSKQ